MFIVRLADFSEFDICCGTRNLCRNGAGTLRADVKMKAVEGGTRMTRLIGFTF